MTNQTNKVISGRLFLRIILIPVGLLLLSGNLFAQEEPPMPIIVSVIRNISFGGFVQLPGSGSISVSHDGNRTGTNVSFISGYTYSSGQFTIEGTINTPITILVDVNPITLTNGSGGTMTLLIDSWSFATPPNYVLPTSSPATSSLYFGGTLTVPAASPPGNYSGTLSFTFIQNNE